MRKQRKCNGWFVEFYEIFSGIFEQYAQFANNKFAIPLTFKHFFMSMKEKTGGGSGVPVIDIEGTIIRGFAPEEIKAEIEKKRAL